MNSFISKDLSRIFYLKEKNDSELIENGSATSLNMIWKYTKKEKKEVFSPRNGSLREIPGETTYCSYNIAYGLKTKDISWFSYVILRYE